MQFVFFILKTFNFFLWKTIDFVENLKIREIAGGGTGSCSLRHYNAMCTKIDMSFTPKGYTSEKRFRTKDRL